MTYMTFNSSCSYAGVANMLERFGYATDDRTIAMNMKLPYLFAFRDGVYMAGPMLQSAEWFNLYLNPIGFSMKETVVPADGLAAFLKQQRTAMLGIEAEPGNKHAIVFDGTEDGALSFTNNKRKDDPSPERFLFTEAELTARAEPQVTVATLDRITPMKVAFAERFRNSVCVIRQNAAAIRTVCASRKTVGSLHKMLNTLFRPLLLDGITMLDLLGEAALAATFTSLQARLLGALHQDANAVIRLGDDLPADELTDATERYIELIENELIKIQA